MPVSRLCAANAGPQFEIPKHDLVDQLSRFPLADVLWALAMALDVYLAVFHHFDGRALQKLEIMYVVAITVLTFIPALVFLFIRTPARGPIYGGAIVSITCMLGRIRRSN